MLTKCEECEFEKCSSHVGMGLPMCNHPEVMKYQRFGRFSGHYGEEDPPKWCPLLKSPGKDNKGEEVMENKEKKNRGIVNLSISRLKPHPNNPRKDVGDVEELAKSLKVNGCMQNLTVVPERGVTHITPTCMFTVIIGHRRLAAAKKAGLTELPCRIVEGMDEREQLSTMLEENMQRSDLTVYEQAEGFQMMLDLGETMDTIKEKTGFSETTIRHRLNIAKLDKKKVREAVDSFQISITDLAKLERIKDVKTRNKVLSDCRDHRDFEWKVNSAAQEEKRDAAEKELMKLLEKYGVKKKAPGNISIYNPDVITVKEFDLDGKLPKKSFKWDREPEEGAELFLYRSYGGNCKIIYKGNPKKAKKTKEQLKKDEVEKKKKKIRAILKGFNDDRRSFIMDVIAGNYSDPEDPEQLARECFDLLIKCCSSISLNELAGYLANKEFWHLPKDVAEIYRKKAEALSMGQALLILADTRVRETDPVSYDGKYVRKDQEYSTSVFYLYKLLDILKGYGFQLDDPEVEAVLDGSSELYVKEGE